VGKEKTLGVFRSIMSLKATREELLQSEDVQRKIAEGAYYKAEQGGFAAGSEHDHWVEAEAETLEELRRESGENGDQAPAKTTRKRATTAQSAEPATSETEGKAAAPKATASKASKTAAAKMKAADAAAVPPAKPAAAKRTTKKTS
jgi:hypothetical protein